MEFIDLEKAYDRVPRDFEVYIIMKGFYHIQVRN